MHAKYFRSTGHGSSPNGDLKKETNLPPCIALAWRTQYVEESGGLESQGYKTLTEATACTHMDYFAFTVLAT